MCPLSWAMGEYINLLAAIQTGHTDAPAVVVRRYSADKPQVTVHFTVNASPRPHDAVYLVGDDPLLGGGNPGSGIRLRRSGPEYSTTVSLPASTAFKYTYAIIPAGGGEPVFDAAPMREFVTPESGSSGRSDRFKAK